MTNDTVAISPRPQGKLLQDLIKGANSKAIATELSIKFSRYLRLHLADTQQARQILSSALETDAANPKLYLQQLDLLINSSPMDVSAVTGGFERALAQDFPDKQKLLFSKRKLEFLGDFGTDLHTVLIALEIFEKSGNSGTHTPIK